MMPPPQSNMNQSNPKNQMKKQQTKEAPKPAHAPNSKGLPPARRIKIKLGSGVIQDLEYKYKDNTVRTTK